MSEWQESLPGLFSGPGEMVRVAFASRDAALAWARWAGGVWGVTLRVVHVRANVGQAGEWCVEVTRDQQRLVRAITGGG